ncbi:hypothetical protein PN450_06110 [Dolichospermum lemmermannii CS-548]|uniref:hypothetical protein n=1 Tax=Dolichospermum lemmermannii TaxID=54295 RepID=UPI00232FBABE|nr:hypothetical protein [Dolichospermum lemmermannii]MDB9436387.1 hypothetical protein [Dolichospermum lemmermannii CS-548]
MTITAEKALLNNQSILQSFGLVEEIDEQSAEVISGGKMFTIVNNTSNNVGYSLDDVPMLIQPGNQQNFDTEFGGVIVFDKDINPNAINVKRKELKDGKTYQFITKAADPNMIEIVQ